MVAVGSHALAMNQNEAMLACTEPRRPESFSLGCDLASSQPKKASRLGRQPFLFKENLRLDLSVSTGYRGGARVGGRVAKSPRKVRVRAQKVPSVGGQSLTVVHVSMLFASSST